MKIPQFLGGTDEQRSKNLSDNKLINLYPVTNNDGSVSALYKVEGLKQEATLSGIPTGAYKTTTNRAFYVSGTTLYELNSDLTSTSRGTLTAGNYSFSDNGIELICVNGTNGWLFTLATNTLTQIKVLTGDVTITVASPAVLTKTSHGLIAGDRVVLSTTGVLPNGLTTNTPYYVLSAGLTANAFELSETAGGTAINTTYTNTTACTFRNDFTTYAGTAVTISNASPAIVTLANHNFITGDCFFLNTSGSLPTPLAVTTQYYVKYVNANTFELSSTPGGTSINTSSAGAGTHTIWSYLQGTVKTTDENDLIPGTEIQFQTTGALPTGLSVLTNYYVTGIFGVFSGAANLYIDTASGQLNAGLGVGSKVYFYNTTGLPSGLVEGQAYYLIASGATDPSVFKISASLGGAEIPFQLGPNSAATVIIKEAYSFSVSSSLANIYTSAITLSGTASGTHTYVKTSSMQYGTHTFTTLGYGFPEGCTTVSYMNGRFIACEPNTQNFYVSEVLDGWYWDALNVQTVDSNPDYVTAQVVSHNECIVFCEYSGEVFYDSGSLPSPFVRNQSGIFEVGCNAPFSISVLDNSIFWLGQSKEGDGIVYRLNGYTPTRISTYSIEQTIKSFTTKTDAKAFSYQLEGHHFYVLTFPTEGKTFVYDANTNLWHERASFISSAFGRWEANDFLYFNGVQYVTDYNSTKLYSLDVDTYSNGSNPIKVVRSFRTPQADLNRVPHNRLMLDAEVGTAGINESEPQIMMRWSDDLGYTWSNLKTKGLGAVGEYFKRVTFNRLGATKGQPRVYELSSTSDAKIVLIGVYIE